MLQSKYSTNVSILKQLGNNYKVTTMNYLPNPGFERDTHIPKNSVNNKKLKNNLVRAKTTVQEIGLCNNWDFFVTLTINKQYFDRYNLKSFYKVFSQWVRNYNKKYGLSIKYLFIPEQHKDGAWHFHGFIYGLPTSHLHRFEIGDIMGKDIADRVIKGRNLYKWQAYEDKFGFNSIEPIRYKEKAVSYILKYISKDLANTVGELGAHLYYASKGLKRATELKRGTLMENIPVDFENEYCKISNLSGDEYTAEYLESIIFGLNDSY